MDDCGSFRRRAGAHEDPNGIDATTQCAAEDIRKAGGPFDGHSFGDTGGHHRNDAERVSGRSESHAGSDSEDKPESRIDGGNERDARRHKCGQSDCGCCARKSDSGSHGYNTPSIHTECDTCCQCRESYSSGNCSDLCDSDTRSLRFG